MSSQSAALREQGLEAIKAGKIDQAIELLSRAVMADDADAESKALLGVAYSNKGLHNQARRALQTAVELEPQNANFHFNLGVAHERAGDLKGAAIAWRDALHYRPNHPQAMAKLKGLGPQAQALLAGAPPPRSVPVGIPGIHPPAGTEPGFETYTVPAAGTASPATLIGAMPAAPPPPAAASPAAGSGLTAGPPGTVQCGGCGQWARAGLSCEFCSAPLRPPAPVPSPYAASQMYQHTAAPGYAGPMTAWTGAPVMETGEAFFRRLAASFIDGIIISVAFGLIAGVLFGTGLVAAGLEPGTPEADLTMTTIGAALLLTGAVALGTYSGAMYSLYGATVGKMAMGIRVVGPEGGNPGFWRGFMRDTVCKELSGCPCVLGYFWMLWDPEQQTWHDKICATHVTTR